MSDAPSPVSLHVLWNTMRARRVVRLRYLNGELKTYKEYVRP